MGSAAPRIINRSRLRGDDLRRFLLKGLSARGAFGQVDEIEVLSAPYYNTLAWAWQDLRKIQLKIPKGFRPDRDVKELAQIFEHEIDHILGLEHREMAYWNTFHSRWSDDLTLRLQHDATLDPVKEEVECQIRDLFVALACLEAGEPIPRETVRMVGGRRHRKKRLRRPKR